MATEDFSFPIIGDNFPCSIDSPPLWHLSPAASANSCHEENNEEEEEEEEDCFAPKPRQNTQRRSFSCVEGGGKLKDDEKEDDDDEEEKMDMLWEDFNHEERMCRITSCSSRSDASSSRDNMVEFGCVKAMAATPKNPNTALSTRKPGVLVMMKVLKKLFLLQNSHRKLKRRGPHSHQ
ncbi:hypothetical protein I3843_16G061200 [Carya illinoinensis]|uniref:Uncharacterized protein n=1 Tax=Carya illinoinensis TaxID=32201 RepID=A0A8T1N877_CARIL|nr:uncharacterized protein LOC122298823 [Carya illinoinensis]KAG6624953.1 hypothetical protein CIPAW_16G062200 [Carya illinoinensis]KAG7941747.1 hypothetical protein I3843_16G061200 [Carya illinoinensis]